MGNQDAGCQQQGYLYAAEFHFVSLCVQSGVTSTPLNPQGRVSVEGTAGTIAQPPGVSYRLVKFDSSSGSNMDTPGRFMLSGESVTQATPLFKPAEVQSLLANSLISVLPPLHCFCLASLPQLLLQAPLLSLPMLLIASPTGSI